MARALRSDRPLESRRRTRLPVSVRRVLPGDAVALQAFYAQLSPDSRRARFLGSCPGLSDRQSLSFCTPDHQHAEGFVAVADEPGGEPSGGQRLVGHLCLEPISERRLELAVAVADEWQGRGIGRALFEAALRWAGQRGIEAIDATAYADNARVLRLLSSAPHRPIIRGPDAGVVTVTIPLVAPLPAAWQRVPPTARPAKPTRSRLPTRRCRVFWRRRRPPVRGAAG